MEPDDPAWPEPVSEHDGPERLALVEVPTAAVSFRQLEECLVRGSRREARPWSSSKMCRARAFGQARLSDENGWRSPPNLYGRIERKLPHVVRGLTTANPMALVT
jgi:hypothetical protein